jgi:ubiquinone/menaquinone biosynthesis C-methylase UbiE
MIGDHQRSGSLHEATRRPNAGSRCDEDEMTDPDAHNTQAAHSRPTVIRAFDVVSRLYDFGALQRLVYRPNHDAVLGELRRIGARRVLDVGCGTGILATRIQQGLRPEQVIGCDPSEGMLGQARARSADVRWLHGTAERLPLDDGSVDAVVSTEAFQFFDQAAALHEFRRVLEPGGSLVLAVITPLVPTGALAHGAAVRWRTRGELRRIVEETGFELTVQRPVRRWLGPLSPGVATVATRS